MDEFFVKNINLDNLPNKPGVYQFLNSSDKIIYVGKAKNLKNRVRSYFQHGKIFDAKTKALITNIANVEFIVVDSEIEALLLEDNLIKKHKNIKKIGVDCRILQYETTISKRHRSVQIKSNDEWIDLPYGKY